MNYAALGNLLTHYFIAFFLYESFPEFSKYYLTIIITLCGIYVSATAHVCEVFSGINCIGDPKELWFRDHITAEATVIAFSILLLGLKNKTQESAFMIITELILLFYKLFTDTQFFTGIFAVVVIIIVHIRRSFPIKPIIIAYMMLLFAFILFFMESWLFDSLDGIRIYYDQPIIAYITHALWHILVYVSLKFLIVADREGVFRKGLF